MKLSKVERLMLANQYKILELLDPGEAAYYRRMQQVFEAGYEIEYDWSIQHVYDDEHVLSREECLYVIHVMSMYEALQRSYNALANKEGLEEHSVLFPGFDGNNEGQYLGYASFAREQDGKFSYLRLSGNDLNSHFPTRDMYQRMMSRWIHLGKRYELTRDELKSIIDERIHPDNR